MQHNAINMMNEEKRNHIFLCGCCCVCFLHMPSHEYKDDDDSFMPIITLMIVIRMMVFASAADDSVMHGKHSDEVKNVYSQPYGCVYGR